MPYESSPFEPSSSMTTDSATIAIIEDDAAMRTSLVRLLSAMGYDVERYDSPEAFLANVDRCKAACLIIDLHLGSMSGLDLARHPSVAALKRPVILNSACDDAAVREQAAAAGCCAFLSKPYTATELLAALGRAAELSSTS
jgi:FixJ family two-component response regulator